MSELSVGTLSGLAANSYVIDVASGSQLTQPGMILQVVSTTKTDAFASSGASFVDVTGMTATITPSSATNKIFVSFSGSVSGGATNPVYGLLLRNSTPISVGDSSLSRSPVTFNFPTVNTAHPFTATAFVLDDPQTTSAITYKLQMRANGASAFYLNRGEADVNDPSYPRTAATLTLMEVAV